MFIILIVILIFVFYYKDTHRPKNYPPGPPWTPFLGNSREIKALSQKLGGQHLAYEYLSKKYNSNILGLKFGNDLTVIVNSYKAVREALTSEPFEGRTDNFFVRLRCLGARRGITCVDGPFWIEQRRFVERHLKNVGYGKKLMENKIQTEISGIINLLNTEKKSFRFGPLVAPSILNVLWTLSTGDNLDRDDPRLHDFLKILKERNLAFDMAGGMLNTLPWLRFIVPEKIGYNLIVKMNKQLIEFFRETIQQHHKTWTPENRDDIIYSFITEMKMNPESENFTDQQLLAICLDIFFGGANTTSVTIEFIFLNLIMNPEIQEKCAAEILQNLNMEELITYKDRFKVPYVEAVILETERLQGIIPLSAPRRVLKDTTLQGYHLKKDTSMFINFHSVNLDEEFWGDPLNFRPERFFNEDGKFVMLDRVINFGLGKRRCLGEALARQSLFIFVASILRKFRLCKGPDSEPLSAKPVPGITLSPSPYTAVAIPH